MLLTSQVVLVVKKKKNKNKTKKKKMLANKGNIRDTGLMPGSGRYPGEGNGSPLQYSCLGNPMDQRT